MEASEFWTNVLSDVKLQLTKASFDNHLARTRAVSYSDGRLTVMAQPLSRDVIAVRLNDIITRTASRIAGAPVCVEYTSDEPVQPEPQPDPEPPGANEDIQVKGDYVDARMEMIKPNKIYPVTEYFRLKWVPRLGNILAWFIIALRQHAYWNKHTGETRNNFRWSYEDAAREIGVSSDALWRARKMVCAECPTTHPILEHFVIEEVPIIEYNQTLKKRVRVATSFRVRMDEPLVPPDEVALQDRLSTASPTPRKRG